MPFIDSCCLENIIFIYLRKFLLFFKYLINLGGERKENNKGKHYERGRKKDGETFNIERGRECERRTDRLDRGRKTD